VKSANLQKYQPKREEISQPAGYISQSGEEISQPAEISAKVERESANLQKYQPNQIKPQQKAE
jgi:hypothetical protein